MLNNLSYEDLLELEKDIQAEKKKFIDIKGATITGMSCETITLETKNTSYTYSNVFDEIISTPIATRKEGKPLIHILARLDIHLSRYIRLEDLKELCGRLLGIFLTNENFHIQGKR